MFMTEKSLDHRTTDGTGYSDVPSLSSLHTLADAAHRLRAIIHAAETLTEKQILTELDRAALDGLLMVGRDCTTQLIGDIEQLNAICVASEPTN